MVNDQIRAAKDQKAQLKQELVEQERIHQSTAESLESHKEEHASEEEALHAKEKSCRFIMNNLEIRKIHMDSEITALQQAREFLSNTATPTGAK